MKISPKDLIRPSWKRNWGVVVAPFEGTPSNTQALNESISFTDEFAYMRPILDSLLIVAERFKVATIFEFSATPLGTAHSQATAILGLEGQHLSLYGNRHGRASMLRANSVALAEIKKQGRWVTDQSLRRYEKAAATQALAKKIPNHILEYGEQVKQLLPTVATFLSSYVACRKTDPAVAQDLLTLIVRRLPPCPEAQQGTTTLGLP